MNKLDYCIVCNSIDNRKFYPGIVRCSSCDHIFADLELSDEQYNKLYDHNYFHGKEYSNYKQDKKVLQKNFNLRLKILKKFKSFVSHNLLEIGSAYGFFLEVANKYFLKVKGIDITREGCYHAKNKLRLDVICQDFLKWNVKSAQYDIICMWDTIEHLKRPDLFIKKINKVLKKDGLLALTTGDISSIVAKLRGEKWRLIHPPTHVHYFSRKVLLNLLTKHGFEVVYVGYPGFYRSLDNIFYNIFVLRLKFESLYKFLKQIFMFKTNFYFNTYDIMYVIAKKRN